MNHPGEAHLQGGRLMHTASGVVASIALMGLFALAPAASAASPPKEPVKCAELATDPANGLLGNRFVKLVGSAIIPADGANVAHCRVDLVYGTNPQQNITIRVGLPLNSVDGGSGGVQGAWNGRTQGIGG